MPERDDEASDMEKGRIDFDFVFITHHQAAIISQPGKRTLHLPAFAIAPQFAPVLERRTPPVLAMRTDQLAAAPLEFSPRAIAVVTLVGDDSAQPTPGSPASGAGH